MKTWKRSFLQKLETAKKQWLHKFEAFAEEQLQPAFGEFDEFATSSGFRVTTPNCEQGTRLFKFALTENGYLLVTFHMKGLEEIEVSSEVCVPGAGRLDPANKCAPLCEVGQPWVVKQFQNALDLFVTTFAEAGANSQSEVLVKA